MIPAMVRRAFGLLASILLLASLSLRGGGDDGLGFPVPDLLGPLGTPLCSVRGALKHPSAENSRTDLIYADGATEVTTYDENGNVRTHQDAKGQVTTFVYDALNRRTSATYPPDPETNDDLQSIVYEYDPNNNLEEVTEVFEQSGSLVTTRTYDDFDRLETVTDRWNNELRYAYDANGNRIHLTDPQSRTTVYTYDDLNRMQTVTTPAGVTEYLYFRNSRLKEIRYPNGTKASYVYDLANRVKQIENRHNTALASRFEYDYDLNGNRIE